jgi:hypothetical protein
MIENEKKFDEIKDNKDNNPDDNKFDPANSYKLNDDKFNQAKEHLTHMVKV